MAIGLVLTSDYGTILKSKKYNLDILILRSEYSKKSNIQKLKAKSSLRKMAPNINITFIKPPLKPCRWPRKINA